MASIIQVLSDETINQIAAGEVVESPASVVKELVENAIDARAKRVTIEITGGGLKMVRISDDGVGMSKEDAYLSLQRHATSKIKSLDDLLSCSTKGFRGEALASIASVSKMSVTTAREGEVGVKLEVEGGKVLKERKLPRSSGTSIEVLSLFYNVPARKKFQKSAAAIAAEVFRIATLMALSHTEVGFTLISNGRKTIDVPAQSMKERAKALLGHEFSSACYPLSHSEGALELKGLIGAPSYHRNNKMGQYLFINKRSVSSPLIAEAVREGYGTRMEERRHPVFLLYLNAPKKWIDVNVHPQKLEVRLQEEDRFRDFTARAVQKALSPKREKPLPKSFTFTPPKEDITSYSLKEEEPVWVETPLVEPEEPIIGLSGHYLFVQGEGGIKLVDLKRGKRRLLFEELLSGDRGVRAKQGLLIPLLISLSAIEVAMVLTHKDAIEEFGFALSLAEREKIRVEALPTFMDERDVERTLSDIASSLQSLIGEVDIEKKRQSLLSHALTSSWRSTSSFSLEEGREIFRKLKGCEDPHHCPKGAPTYAELSHDAIENLFGQSKNPKCKA